MARLASLTIHGYKTVRDLDNFAPGALSVLIGQNGAGKSNLISFFRMLSFAMNGDFETYVAQAGSASSILHDGPEVTREMSCHLRLDSSTGQNEYQFRLSYASGDRLVFLEEKMRYSASHIGGLADWLDLGVGQLAPRLPLKADQGDKTASAIRAMLRKIIVHQFHNTSATARIRNTWDIEDGRRLKEDAGNLSAFLRRLRSDAPGSYLRIVETIRLIAPFFNDFELEPNAGRVLLCWREKGSDRVFSAGQASDGFLRIAALVALLCQPTQDLPDLLILDEPELGLHPAAIDVVMGLVAAAARSIQVIIATQSVAVVDQLNPNEIVVVEREGRASTLRRLDPVPLQAWLQDYSLSDLWKMNLLGGRPSAWHG